MHYWFQNVQSRYACETEWVCQCESDDPCATCAMFPECLNVTYARYPSTLSTISDQSIEDDNNNIGLHQHILQQSAFKSQSANCSFDCDNVESAGKSVPRHLLSAPAPKVRSYSTNSANRDCSYASTPNGLLMPPEYSKRRTSSDSSEHSGANTEHISCLDLIHKHNRLQLHIISILWVPIFLLITGLFSKKVGQKSRAVLPVESIFL